MTATGAYVLPAVLQSFVLVGRQLVIPVLAYGTPIFKLVIDQIVNRGRKQIEKKIEKELISNVVDTLRKTKAGLILCTLSGEIIARLPRSSSAKDDSVIPLLNSTPLNPLSNQSRSISLKDRRTLAKSSQPLPDWVISLKDKSSLAKFSCPRRQTKLLDFRLK